jgi:hypothetical protein
LYEYNLKTFIIGQTAFATILGRNVLNDRLRSPLNVAGFSFGCK